MLPCIVFILPSTTYKSCLTSQTAGDAGTNAGIMDHGQQDEGDNGRMNSNAADYGRVIKFKKREGLGLVGEEDLMMKKGFLDSGVAALSSVSNKEAAKVSHT